LAGEQVIGAQGEAQPAGDLAQQLVAGVVTVRVVDRLERDEVEEQQRGGGPGASPALERVGQRCAEVRAAARSTMASRRPGS